MDEETAGAEGSEEGLVAEGPAEDVPVDAEPGPPQHSVDELLASGDLEAHVVAALKAERARAQDAEDRMLRAVAEAENQKKRIEREYKERARYANEGVLGELLVVFDSLELALGQSSPGEGGQALHEGVQLALQQFLSALETTGVTPIEAAEGDAFDPKAHEALLRDDEADLPPQTIAKVMQRGFRYHERILRPARVVVSTGKGQKK